MFTIFKVGLQCLQNAVWKYSGIWLACPVLHYRCMAKRRDIFTLGNYLNLLYLKPNIDAHTHTHAERKKCGVFFCLSCLTCPPGAPRVIPVHLWLITSSVCLTCCLHCQPQLINYLPLCADSGPNLESLPNCSNVLPAS